jgi:septal ring factor EnvC (AmiA/AmiB activator)
LTERELARAEGDELAWRQLVLDRLGSLRTGLVVLGVLAVAALGIALWALLDVRSSGDVSAARVRSLERRVDRLQTEVRSTPSSAALTSLQASQQALDNQVSSLAARLQRVEQTNVELKATLSSVQQRVSALERQTPTPTPTP